MRLAMMGGGVGVGVGCMNVSRIVREMALSRSPHLDRTDWRCASGCADIAATDDPNET